MNRLLYERGVIYFAGGKLGGVMMAFGYEIIDDENNPFIQAVNDRIDRDGFIMYGC